MSAVNLTRFFQNLSGKNKQRSQKAVQKQRRSILLEQLERREVFDAFGLGNIVVQQIGTVATSGANPVDLVEFAPATANQASPVQTIALPNATTRPTVAPFNIMDSGNATSNGYLSRSTDGSMLVIPGYNGIAGDTSIASSVGTTVNRVIGTVGANGIVSTSIAGTWSSGNNFRSVASVDGSNFWTAGGVGMSSVTTVGGAGTTLTGGNARIANIFNSQLFVSSSSTSFNGSGSNVGIWTVGTGTPTSALPTVPTSELVNVINTAGSPYDFAVSPDGLTIYVADDRSTVAGGVQKWTSATGAAGSFTLAYTLPTGAANVGARGLTVDFSGANPVIIGTSAEASANRVFRLVDTGSAATATTLATAPTGKIFRGVDFAPQSATDTTPPQVVSIDSGDADNNVAPGDVLTYEVTFNEDINGASVTDVDFDNLGTAPITVGAVTQVSARVFSFSVTPTAVGTLQLRVAGDASITDVAGNELVVPVEDNDTVNVTAVDTIAPTILSIDDGDSDNIVPAGVALTYTVVFSEDIDSSTVTDADFDNDGTAAITIGTITETAPGTFTVQVTPTTDGSLKLRIPTGAVIADVAATGNNLVVPVSDTDTITVDGTAPTITSVTNSATTGSVPQFQPITYTINFSEDISAASVELADFVNVGTATVAFSNLFRVSATQYTLRATPSTTGTVQLSIPTGAVVSDIAGNPVAVPFNDAVSLSVFATTSLATGAIAFTGIRSDDTDSFSFVLLQDVVAGTSLTFNDNLWSNATNTFATNENLMTIFFSADTPAGTHIKYTAPVTTPTAVPSSLVLVGTTTSVGTTVGDINGLSTSGDSLLAYQGSAPTAGNAANWIAAISTRSFTTNPTGTNQSELPTALTLGSTAFVLSATATDIDNGIYNQASFTGTPVQIRASVNNLANWTVNDDPLLVPEVNTAFTVGADTTAPTITSIDDGDADNSVLVNAALIYTVTFSEDIDATTVTAADFDNAGTAAITIGAITETSPGVFTVSVTPTTDGTLILRVPAGAEISDLSANNLVVPVVDGDTVNVLLADVTPPTIVSIDSSAPSNQAVTNEAITYTIVFSEPIDLASVSAADFDNAGTATITIGAIAQTVPGTLTVSVTPTSAGTLILRIPTGATIADASNNNLVVPVQDSDTVTVADLQPIYINELMFNPPDTDAPNEYIELRGTPGSVIPAGTYFVGIEGDASTLGDVQNIFNLSGLAFGSNGILVLLQKGSTYTPAAASAVYTNTGSGAGWGSGATSSVGHSGDSGATDIENASATYAIIRTAVAPTLTDDIDTVGGTQGDGTPDGAIYAGWTVLDSVGVLDTSAAGDFSYGATTFANSTGGGASTTGTVVPVAFTAGFIARLASSTGSAASDWIAADISTGTAPNFALPLTALSQTQFASSPLNNLGAANNFSQAPTDIGLSSSSVAENLAIGSTVGTLSTVDPDVGDTTFTYSLVSGTGATDNASFSISGTSLLTAEVFNFEVKSTYSIRVKTTDPAGATFEKVFTISVTNASEAPVFGAASYTFSLAENSVSGTPVGSVSASDPDAATTLMYGLSGANASRFAIDPTTGAITVATGAVLDFEATPSLNFNATVSDGTSTVSVPVTVNLTDVAEGLTVAPQTFTINNKSLNGALVGRVVTNATLGQTVVFAITSGNTGSAFSIDSATGTIRVNDAVTLPVVAKGSTTVDAVLGVSATTNGITTNATMTVTLSSAGIRMVPTVNAATFTIAENNKPLAKVGSVVPLAAYSGQKFTFNDLSGTDAASFAIDAKGGITLASGVALNFEDKNTYTFNVNVADSLDATKVTTAAVTVNVTNVNEAPSYSMVLGTAGAPVTITGGVATLSLDENIPTNATKNGLVIATLTDTDPDAGSVLTDEMIPDKTGAFGYNPTTGAISIIDESKVSFESAKSIKLSFTLTDNGTPKAITTKLTVTVNLNDLNEAPVITGGPTATFTIAENNKAGAKVGSVKAADPDTKAATKQTLTYSIFSQKDASNTDVSIFAVDSKGGITVPTAGALDFEASPSYTLVVRVTDSGSPTLYTEQTITVNVTDVNDASVLTLQNASNGAATSLSISLAAVSNNTKVGRLLISDADAGAAGTYAAGSITAAVEAASKQALTYNEATGDILVKDKTKLTKTFDLKLALKDSSAKALTAKFSATINITA
jgi:hypothetical protein